MKDRKYTLTEKTVTASKSNFAILAQSNMIVQIGNRFEPYI